MLQSELKFLVSERTAMELRRWARMHFTPDLHAVVPSDAILELKNASERSPIFEEGIEIFNLHSHSNSKYRLAVRKLGLADDKERMLAHA